MAPGSIPGRAGSKESEEMISQRSFATCPGKPNCITPQSDKGANCERGSRMPQFSFVYSAKSILGVLACAGLFLISSPKAISQTFYGSLWGPVTDFKVAITSGSPVTPTKTGDFR